MGSEMCIRDSDPNNLSYFYNGLDQKLVGVEGAEPIYQALA